MDTSSPSRVARKSSARRRRATSTLPPQQTPESHEAALASIRSFLRGRSSYDVFPVSFRTIVLDNKMEIKKALHALLSNSVVSAPLWNGETARFAGMFTVQDIIHLIQYYYNNYSTIEAAGRDVDQFRLESLRDIERELGVPTPALTHLHPMRPLWDACKLLMSTHARRVPLLDIQPTGEEVVLSVLTQYRALKAVATNVREISHLHMSLRSLGIGTYVEPTEDNPFHPISTATLDTTVFDVVHQFSERGISAVPIIDENGIVLNLYETVDVITLVRLGAYQNLDLTIASALKQRSSDFPGVITCAPTDSLASLLLLIKQRRVHRLVVVEGADRGQKGRLVGIITLSDVLDYIISEPSTSSTNPSTPGPSRLGVPQETPR